MEHLDLVDMHQVKPTWCLNLSNIKDVKLKKMTEISILIKMVDFLLGLGSIIWSIFIKSETSNEFIPFLLGPIPIKYNVHSF